MAAPPHGDAMGEHIADAPAAAVEAYFRAVDGARSADMPRAFAESALMFWIADGKLMTLSQPEWRARLDAARAPNPAIERTVDRVIVDGDIALAFATAHFPTFTFQDALLLQKLDRGWRIVGKVFHKREPADRPLLDGPARAREEGAIREALARGVRPARAVREITVLEDVAAARLTGAHALLVKVGDAWQIASISCTRRP